MNSKCVSAPSVGNGELVGPSFHGCSSRWSNSSHDHRQTHASSSNLIANGSRHTKTPSKKYTLHDLSSHDIHHYGRSSLDVSIGSDSSFHRETLSTSNHSKSISNSSHHQKRSTESTIRRPPWLRFILVCLVVLSFWRTAQSIFETNQQVMMVLPDISQVLSLTETTQVFAEQISAMMLDGSFFETSFVFGMGYEEDQEEEDAPVDESQRVVASAGSSENMDEAASATKAIEGNSPKQPFENHQGRTEDKRSSPINKDTKTDSSVPVYKTEQTPNKKSSSDTRPNGMDSQLLRFG